MMKLSRRAALLGAAGALWAWGGAGRSRAQAPNQWHDLTDGEGAVLPNMRLPVELTSEVDRLPGVFWMGAAQPVVSLVEVYDYNCPWCHAAAQDLHALMQDQGDLRVGFMNNPILSLQSAEAAKVELALTRLMGAQVVYDFYRAMFGQKRRADGAAALAAARIVTDGRAPTTEEGRRHGVNMAAVERMANDPDTGRALEAQMKLARSLGMSATPSFIVGGVGIQGYPGRRKLADIIAAMRRCDEPTCKD